MVAGVKIPDIIAFPTGTFQVAYDGVLATANGGDSVMVQMTPYIGDDSSVYPIITANSTSPGSLATTANKSWGGVTSIIGLYTGFRPVSGMIEAEFIGPSSDDGGQMGGHLIPAQMSTTANSWDTFLAVPGTEIVPLRNGMRVLWKPEDNSDFEFVTKVGSVNGATHAYPKIAIAVTGLPTVGPKTYVRFHIVCNFEAIPGTDATNLVHVDASPYDVGQLRSAFEWAAQTANNIYTLYNTAGPYLQAAGGIVSSAGSLLRSGRQIANLLTN